MLKKYLLLTAVAGLSACTTPQTTLRNPKTGQVAVCGGNVGGSLAGGVIGYHIQKGNDEACANTYLQQGFTVLETKE